MTPEETRTRHREEEDARLAKILRDVADLAAVRGLSIPAALREVADQLSPDPHGLHW